MTKTQFKKFEILREEFKKKIEEWNTKYPEHKDDFVYNTALDRITEKNNIKLIIVGDNPGKDEKVKGEYFVGKTGKMCQTFFTKALEGEGVKDFEKNVIVLNKTPISTAKTLDLADETKFSKEMVAETQRWMAELTANLCETFKLDAFIIGSSLFAPGKLFEPFARSLKENFTRLDSKFILVFKHFSYGHFIKDWNNMTNHFRKYEKKLELYGYKSEEDKQEFVFDTVDSDEEDDTQIIDDAGKFWIIAKCSDAYYDYTLELLEKLGKGNYDATIRKYYP